MSNELQIKRSLEIGKIEWNFEELKKNLEEGLKADLKNVEKNILITEEEISNFASRKAELNNIVKSINEVKKAVKTEYNKPYLLFEEQAKELMSIVDSASQFYKEQLDEHEQKRQNEKREVIEAHIEEVGLTMVLDLIFDTKWLNKTTSEKKWKQEIDNFKVKIEEDLQTIDLMQVEDKVKFKSYYLDCLSITQAREKYERDIERSKAFNISNDTKVAETVEKPSEEKLDTSQEILKVAFVVEGTYNQLVDLGEYMNKQNIKFKKVSE